MRVGKSIELIVDASFVLARLLPDESSLDVDEVFDEFAKGRIDFFASPILPLEIINGLRYAYPKRITKTQVIDLLEDFMNFKIKYLELNLQKVFEISIDKKLSVYDASYLYLAEKHNYKLLTLDKTLNKLARKN